MELKEFIKATITSIAESVSELNVELNGKVIINPNLSDSTDTININAYPFVKNEGFGSGDKEDSRAIVELKVTTKTDSNMIEFTLPIVIQSKH